MMRSDIPPGWRRRHRPADDADSGTRQRRHNPLQHFHLHEGGNRLHIFRRQGVQKAEHDLAPGPETVAAFATAPLAHARHGPLERMAVQVDRGRQKNADAFADWLRISFNRGDPAVRTDRDSDIFRPAVGQKRLFRKTVAPETVDMPSFPPLTR